MIIFPQLAIFFIGHFGLDAVLMKLRTSRKLAKAAGLLLLLENGTTYADVLPGPAMPEQVNRALQSQAPLPKPKAIPTVEEQKPEEKNLGLSPEAQKIKFKLNKIILEGNHVFSDAQLEPIYKDKIGKEISVADLFQIIQNITNYYRNSGYVLSRAILPPQHVKEGNVKVQIIEGTIGKVDVTGNPRGAQCLVQAIGDNIKQCPPLEVSRMEHYLLVMNEIPGTQVKAVLAPSKSKTGAADLSLVTDTKSYSGYASYDNYGTRYIGPQQMTGSVAFNSILLSGDTLRGTVTKTPKGAELTYGDINYNFSIWDQGSRMTLGATRTQTHPLFVLTPVAIDGATVNLYTMAQFPIIRTRAKNLTARAGFSFMDSDVTSLDFPLYDDHLRNFNVGGTYNFADKWFGANMLSADFYQGLPILGYTSNDNPLTADTSRPGGRGDYTKFMVQASRLQAVKGPFMLYGVATGQYAFNPTLSSQQYAWGGSQIGRGYDPAELLGDRGIGGSIEGRYDLAVEKFLINNIQLYAFYDFGVIWNYWTNGNTIEKNSATSAGFGARVYMTKYVSANFFWAQPLTKQVAAEELIGQGWKPRAFFSLVASL